MTSKLCSEPKALKSIPLSKEEPSLVMLKPRFPIKDPVMEVKKVLINDH